MKMIRYIPILAAAAGLLLATSCVKDTLHNTPHPDKGAVTVSLTGVSAGDNYVLDIDGKSADFTGSSFTFPDLLAPGTHSLVAYNRTEGFTFDGRTARVNALNDETRADGTAIIPLPGYLKTVSQEITVTADDTLRVNAVPVRGDTGPSRTDTERDRHPQRHSRSLRHGEGTDHGRTDLHGLLLHP